jgi:hypothetical protein
MLHFLAALLDAVGRLLAPDRDGAAPWPLRAPRPATLREERLSAAQFLALCARAPHTVVSARPAPPPLGRRGPDAPLGAVIVTRHRGRLPHPPGAPSHASRSVRARR